MLLKLELGVCCCSIIVILLAKARVSMSVLPGTDTPKQPGPPVSDRYTSRSPSATATQTQQWFANVRLMARAQLTVAARTGLMSCFTSSLLLQTASR